MKWTVILWSFSLYFTLITFRWLTENYPFWPFFTAYLLVFVNLMSLLFLSVCDDNKILFLLSDQNQLNIFINDIIIAMISLCIVVSGIKLSLKCTNFSQVKCHTQYMQWQSCLFQVITESGENFATVGFHFFLQSTGY